MPLFKSVQEAVEAHKDYHIDTDLEMKYHPSNIYSRDKHRIQYVLDAIPEGSFILEVGCNSGGLLKLIDYSKGTYSNGVDVCEEMLNRARSKGLTVLNAKAEELPYKDDRFEAVVCTEVIEHLFDPVIALKEIHRVLEPGGVFVGSVPHPEGANSTKKTVERHDYHCKIFKVEEIEKIVKGVFGNCSLELCHYYNDQEKKPQWTCFTAIKETIND